jgi:hypothetical protein
MTNLTPELYRRIWSEGLQDLMIEFFREHGFDTSISSEDRTVWYQKTTQFLKPYGVSFEEVQGWIHTRASEVNPTI